MSHDLSKNRCNDYRSADLPNERPVLFGSPEQQALLLAVFRAGQLRADKTSVGLSAPLMRAGILTLIRRSTQRTLVVFDWRHPFFEALQEVLVRLNNGPGYLPAIAPDRSAEFGIDVARPLGHRSILAFPIVLHLARANAPVPLPTFGAGRPMRIQITYARWRESS